MLLVGKSSAGAGPITIEADPLGKGGEGSVYTVASHQIPGLPSEAQLVAKIYHNPEEGDRQKKIVAMLQSPPNSSSVAWPLAILFNREKQFQGYLMRKLDTGSFRMWATLAHARERKAEAADFDSRYGLTATKNLAIALYSVHAAGHRVGDINESNIFAGADARVLLVDTDSAQILSQQGIIFRCTVGKPEYTAPELSHGALRDQDRTVESDIFAFGVTLFQMMTGGAHPADGAYTGQGDPPSQVERMRNGWLPAVPGAPSGPFTAVPRIASEGLPKRILWVVREAMQVDPQDRPPLKMIIDILEDVIGNLRQCSAAPQHWYDHRDGSCGWCAVAAQNRPDPWSSQRPAPSLPQQTSLPTVNFGAGSSSAPLPQRAAPAIAGQAAHQAQQHQQYKQQTGQQPPPSPAPAAVEPPKPTVEEIQKLYKTKKSILTYADGEMKPRPPLSVLFRTNKKLAVQCFIDEVPTPAVFWWPKKRNLPTWLGLGFGSLLGASLAILWYFILPKLGANYLPSHDVADRIMLGATYLAVGAPLVALSAQILLGVIDRLRYSKKLGGLNSDNLEKPWLTVLKCVSIAICYGPLLILMLVALIFWGALELISGVLKSR